MEKLVWIVGVFNAVVEFILLMAVDRLSGYGTSRWKKVLSAATTGLHGAVCLLPGYEFLREPWWHWGLLLALGTLLYYRGGKTVARMLIMLLLNFGVEGFQRLADQQDMIAFATAGVLIAMICVLSFRDAGSQRYFEVELCYEGKRISVTALADTGNTLRDPVTGVPVMILSSKMAFVLTGLSKQQLAKPLETMESGCLPGLRLIPYHCVGCDNGMLLALNLKGCKVRGKEKDLLVAFAPAGLGKEGTFQALAGGIL